ncbi:hypothetical protein GCM10010446_52100 [Streptomyces enissocaesilis]|uniref:Uncharacterized protein n=1 Tax=Streptomyces enissocaesilis TaxID=332589 RepID=A0ABP6K186_9ACTN
MQVPLPATATAEPDDASPFGEMEAYAQLSAADGTGLSSSQARVVAASRRPRGGGCTSGIMVGVRPWHAVTAPHSPDGWDFRGFAFGIAPAVHRRSWEISANALNTRAPPART